MTSIIKANTCSTCGHRFREPNGDIQCRARPPSAHPMIAMTPKGPIVAGACSVFPIVQPDQWCGEWKALMSNPLQVGNAH